MEDKSFQEYYTTEFSHCFGCGWGNVQGLHVQSHWADEEAGETIAYYRPQSHWTGGYPGNVYGGLLASLIDCHGNGTAFAAGYKYFDRELGSEPALRYVTAHLSIDYRQPTPMGELLEIRAKITKVTERKVEMDLEVWASGSKTVTASMVSVLLPLLTQGAR